MAPQPVNGTERKIGDKPLEYPQAFRLHGGNVKRVGFPTYPPSIFFLILFSIVTRCGVFCGANTVAFGVNLWNELRRNSSRPVTITHVRSPLILPVPLGRKTRGS